MVKLLVGAILFLAVSCVTVEEENQPPEITAETSVAEMFQAAIDFGGSTLKDVKRVTSETNRWPAMAKEARLYLRSSLRQGDRGKIIRAAHIYQASVPTLEPAILKLFTRHPSPEIAVIGWQLATVRPSPTVKSFVEDEVSYFVIRNWEQRILYPELATAVRENEVHSVFSVLQLGLLTKGNDEFAKAMVALNPDDSSVPFMDYLGLATIEDLRQINQSTVDVYTCLVILRHFMTNPLPLGHPNLGQLFSFAVSRNPALSDMARGVIEQQMPTFKEQMVYSLAALPLEVQIAFVEGARRNPSSNFRMLLGQLKLVTRYHQVVEEIESIKTF
ncbi:hypothetical protein [Pseudobacteriovorax antillogorgiicola]|uniref:Uncharacterized protein n=1 Tax=Pseudobacteriovorax antillogorgiicola TaxID=1513793 RepID=A0A1Y6C2Y5_9BACT|nr:hypothetical protein [Pseudobacteriovorax antillogorgiicola]TCS50298.1 hypothetical protein EDD56_113116 [Pseudobacteriovorax antillogorgiicola]SMF33966.1 hypothetical protein SAMN06296036_110115 [Pseudobacteriovorax antillogorgiicola]